MCTLMVSTVVFFSCFLMRHWTQHTDVKCVILLRFTVWGKTLFVTCHGEKKAVKWKRGNKAWQALCFTIQQRPERAVRPTSLRPSHNLRAINLLQNELLWIDFFLFLEQCALICSTLQWIRNEKTFALSIFHFPINYLFQHRVWELSSDYEALTVSG